jgi:hypothetical protein
MTAIALIRAYWKPLAVFLLLLMTWLHGHHTGDTGRDAVWSARWHKHVAEDATLAAAAATAAREQEHKWAAAYDLAVTIEHEETTRVRTQADRIIAGLRAGTHRLSIAPACPGMPEAAADTPAATAGAEGGQPGLAGEELVQRLAVCDEVTLERNMAVSLMRADRSIPADVQ